MADATNAGTVTEPAKTGTSSTTAAATTTPPLSEEARAAGFTAEDFSHPEYGAKAKSLYDGFQKRAESAAKLQRELDSTIKFLSSDPELLAAARRVYRKQQGLAPEEPSQSESGAAPEPTMAEVEARAMESGENLSAMSELFTHLGNGDPMKGRTIYLTDYADDFEKIMPRTSGDPHERIALTLELISHRRNGQKTAASTKEATTETASPSATNEAGRAAPGATPADQARPRTDAEIVQSALRRAGVRDLAEFDRMIRS